MYHLTVGTAIGISEGDAALGQVRRLCDILGGAFLDAEVVGVIMGPPNLCENL